MRFPGSQGTNEAVQVRFELKKPWTIKPGQYIYLSLPSLRSLGLGIFESHPFMIAWSYSDNDDGKDVSKGSTTIVLLVRCCRGFTKKLRLADRTSYAIVDGPYGSNMLRNLSDYDTVLFMADGIGIATHLLPIRHLLLAHDEQTARVRRISLVWLLETKGISPDQHFSFITNYKPDQQGWAEEFLFALHDMDHRKILTVFLVYPSESEGTSQERVFSIKQPRKRIYPLTGKLDMDWWIEKEWSAEAGNMLVTGMYVPIPLELPT